MYQTLLCPNYDLNVSITCRVVALSLEYSKIPDTVGRRMQSVCQQNVKDKVIKLEKSQKRREREVKKKKNIKQMMSSKGIKDKD